MASRWNAPFSVRDQQFSEEDLDLIRWATERFRGLSRQELANTLCEDLPWRAPNGRLRLHSCLGLLEQLAKAGIIDVPRKRKLRAYRSPLVTSFRAALVEENTAVSGKQAAGELRAPALEEGGQKMISTEQRLNEMSEARISERYQALSPFLDEKQRRLLAGAEAINHVHYRNVRMRIPREQYTEVFVDEGEVDMVAVMRELVRQQYPRLIYPEHPPLIDADREHPFKGISSHRYTGFAYTVGYARAMLQAASVG